MSVAALCSESPVSVCSGRPGLAAFELAAGSWQLAARGRSADRMAKGHGDTSTCFVTFLSV